MSGPKPFILSLLTNRQRSFNFVFLFFYFKENLRRLIICKVKRHRFLHHNQKYGGKIVEFGGWLCAVQ